MTTSYKDGKMTFDFVRMLDGLEADEVAEIADALSCRDSVIKNIVAQILDGWTDLMSRAGRVVYALEEPTQGLDWAVREVAKRSGEAAKDEIERLEKELASKRKRIIQLEHEVANFRERFGYGSGA